MVRKQKTDSRDALHVLDLMLQNRFPQIWIPSPEERDLRQLFVQAAFRVEGESQNVAETNVNRSEMATRRDLHDFRRAILDGKGVQVPGEERGSGASDTAIEAASGIQTAQPHEFMKKRRSLYANLYTFT